MKLKTVFFISGKGSNMGSILENCRNIDPVAILTDNSNCIELTKEIRKDIPIFIINHNITNINHYIKIILKQSKPELIILAGYLKIIDKSVIDLYEGRILNIHPSILPRYGGKGMYGNKVHMAILESGDIQTGCTVHVVDSGIDTGKILGQMFTTVNLSDNIETLSKKVLKLEHQLYPKIINDICYKYIQFPIK